MPGAWTLVSGVWSGTAALMRHSSPVRALHCTHAHGTGSSPVFPARLPASCRSTVAVGAPRRSRGCTWGSRIHTRIHSRAGQQPGGWRAAACAVALHWQMEMEIALDQSPSLSRAAGMGNPEPAARAVSLILTVTWLARMKTDAPPRPPTPTSRLRSGTHAAVSHTVTHHIYIVVVQAASYESDHTCQQSAGIQTTHRRLG